MPAIRAWKEPGCIVKIEYSSEALEQVRHLAIDGLLALPRVGMGTGGLLLGTREGDRITILDSLPVPCSHAMGPSFVLTPEETTAARQLALGIAPLSVLGCYESKPRGFSELTERDLEWFAVTCPEPWQVMLQIKPSTVEASRFMLCFRNRSGTVVRGTERELADEPDGEATDAAPVADLVSQPAPEEKSRRLTVAVLVVVVLLVIGAAALLLQLK